MRTLSLVLIAAAAAVVAAPADAATKKRPAYVAPQAGHATREAGVAVRRPRTRITVTRRSYLDAGTEVFPGSQPYTDYVFSPRYVNPRQDIMDPTGSRSNVPDPLWLPFYHVPNWGY